MNSRSLNVNFGSVALVMLFMFGCAQEYYQPEQLHLSYPDDPSKMVVTWSTMSDTDFSVCEYGTDSLKYRAEGNRTLFVDGGIAQRSQFIHRVVLENLTPGQKYWYHCGSILGWSDLFFFSQLQSGGDWSPRFAIIGDMGNANARSLPFLQEKAQKGDLDLIHHVGDFAYDMDSNNATTGDEYMRQVQAFAAYVPYMVTVGNHEQKYNFSNYKNRFSMPSTIDNMFFSYNIGPIHFISFSTEFYYFLDYGTDQVSTQYNWLVDDLKEANKPENRAERPWIITSGHRPMYCSDNYSSDCTKANNIVRIGNATRQWYGLEDLLYSYGVDVAFWGHEHFYERLWPVFNETVLNGSTSEPYTNPGATVHITTGSAGCDEDLANFEETAPPWTAFRAKEYSYTSMTVYNSSHLYLEQVAVDRGGEIIDSIWVKKSKHGPYPDLFPGEADI